MSIPVDFGHSCSFSLPLLGILDNAKAVDPQVPYLESTCDTDRILERLRQERDSYTTLEILEVFECRDKPRRLAPGMAESHIPALTVLAFHESDATL
jgi:hypothetical protein